MVIFFPSQNKNKKQMQFQGVERFNKKAKDGIKYLQENGLLPAEPTAAQIAAFLRSDYRLSKQEIGDYLGRRENEAVLNAFVKSFEFGDRPIEEALRQFLESFRFDNIFLFPPPRLTAFFSVLQASG
jgi:brefeldin A-resistance guanine nucleotide exchange factor 1